MARTGRAFPSHPVATRAPLEAPPDPGVLVAPVTRTGARARAAELRRRRWRTLLLTRAPIEAPPDPGILVAPVDRVGVRARVLELRRSRRQTFVAGAPIEAPPDPGILVAPVTRRGARAEVLELRRRPRRPWLGRLRPTPPPDPGILVAPRGRRGDRARRREQYRFRLRTFVGRLRLPLVTPPPTPITCLTVADAAVTGLELADAAVTGLELADAAVTGLVEELSTCEPVDAAETVILSDAFTTAEAAFWNDSYTPANRSIAAGRLVLTDAGTVYAGVRTTASYSLTGRAVRVELADAGLPRAASAQTYLAVVKDATNFVQWQLSGSWLEAGYAVGGVWTALYGVTYDPLAHRFWQILELDGVTYWRLSPDGTDFRARASTANPIALATVKLEAGHGRYNAGDPNGTVELDNFAYTTASA